MSDSEGAMSGEDYYEEDEYAEEEEDDMDEYTADDNEDEIEEEDDLIQEDIPFHEDDSVAREERGKLHRKHYRCLTQKELRELQDAHIRQANEFLNVNTALVRIVLKHFKWDVEKLLQQWMEEGKDNVFKKAGVQLHEEDEAPTEDKPQPPAKDATVKDCEICYGEISPDESYAVSCGHTFCGDCWGNYLTLKINEEGQKSSHLTCMGHKCNVRVDEATVEKLVAPDVFDKYMGFLLSAYVDDHPLLTWCPAAGCGRAIKITPGPTNVGVLCDCQHLFCFECGQEAHAPATCGMLVAWKAKAKDGSETTNWLLSHTKSCPKCGKPVEKNGGCNHITCPCGAHFCWMCLGLFDSVKVYQHSCNAFDDKNAFSFDAAQRAQAKLERYLHYSTRYDNHAKSKELESKLMGTMKQKTIELGEMDTGNSSWIDLRYLEESTRQLFLCRDILKWTYVFAFFMFDKDEQTPAILKPFKPFVGPRDVAQAKEQFEYHQEELETTTERLSGLLEKTTTQILEDKNYRINVIDVTRLALNKFNAMFGSVEWIQEKVAMGSFQKEEKLMPAAKKSKVEPKPASSASNNRAALFGSGRRRGNHRQQPPVPQPEPTEEDVEEELERVETDTGRRRRTAADEEEELRRAIEESMKEFEPPTPAAGAGGGAVDEDEELQRAIQASLNDM